MTAAPPSTARRQAVIFVNRYYRPDLSATSQMAGDVAGGLAARGVMVRVVTSAQRHDDATARLPPRQVIDGVGVYRVATTRFGRGGLAGRAMDYLTFHLSAAWQVLRLARRGDVVVACTDPPLLSVSLALPAAIAGARRVNWLHDIFPETASALGVVRANGGVDGLLRILRNLSLRGASANVVLGEHMARRVAAMGVAPRRIRIVHNFADGAVIRPEPPTRNPLRTEWNLRDRFVVGYSGNLGRAHEFDTILAAAEELRHREDIVFLFIGDGHRRGPLAAEVDRRGLRNVLFRPLQPLDALSHSLGVPDVHLVSLLPSLEGLIVPSKIYGIAAAGRPALFIGDPDGEVALLVRRHDFGTAVPVGAGARLAAEIELLAASPERWHHWSANARAAFERLYHRDAAVAQWLELLTPDAATATAGAETAAPSAAAGSIER